ncbi:hypothetical protein H2200_000381 [Cladophialophora chaetospira]|uniref:Xylanolytic transcriptional activator regulatory domain-containing protein n=1 Tax=Cladophialophora chaetospira TaxID=386627 RepID=A0AA39CQA0_9EURO|nr:hypothetical protein H2200_000381 [Cladophialophora chaetospira]
MAASLYPLPTPDVPPHINYTDASPSQPSAHRDTGTIAIERQAIDPGSTANADTATPRSLHAMFEDFLRQQGISDEGVAEKLGFVLLSESSPLTFALGEIQQGKNQRPPGNEPQAPRDPTGDALASGSQNGRHPSHMTTHDIAYLQSKGAFDLPESSMMDALLEAFTNRFHPLYSIVDIDQLQLLYRQQRLPWILLQAICFIGATFCDATIIHQSSLKRRSRARRIFYDRTKALFDLGYEANKVVLLQSVLMLTFWGPHMKTYWNPSSWVDFATTIAASLGIHRSSNLLQYDVKNRRLVRRLWWTVLARDASCATLLGRPFRIRLSQCNTEQLTLDDFNRSGKDGHDHELHALYQIHGSRLSLILREIIQWHSGGDLDCEKQTSLHTMLRNWKLDLPTAIDWTSQRNQKNIFANSLKIIYHHHLILLYLGNPGQNHGSVENPSNALSPLAEVVVSAAQIISSSALSLMVSSSVSSMPHEIFTGFFIAGVVFYRQVQQQQSPLAQLQRAALDNCQMILNEARENCDAAQWMMRVFDFLLAGTSNSGGHEVLSSAPGNTSTPAAKGCVASLNDPPHILDSSSEARDLGMLSMDWDYPFPEDPDSLANDFFFLPDLYVPAVGDMADMQFRVHP